MCMYPLQGVCKFEPPFPHLLFLGMAKRASPTRFKWVGPSWPDKAKQVVFLGQARRLAGWRAGPPSFSWYVYFVVQNQILIFFISNLVDWILSQYINVLVVTIIIVRVVCICINTIVHHQSSNKLKWLKTKCKWRLALS